MPEASQQRAEVSRPGPACMCCGAPQCPALSQAEAWRQPTPDKPSNVLLFPSSEDCDGARCCVVQRGERPATVRITVDFVV